MPENELLTKMRMQVSYTDVATMPIPLYEEIKHQLESASDNKMRKALMDLISDIEVQTLDMGDFTWIPTVEYEQAIERAEAALAEEV